MSRSRTEKKKVRIRPLISHRRIQFRIARLARQISHDYHGKDVVLLGILKGSFIFMADLARRIKIPLTCDFMRVSSYGDSRKSSGSVRIDFDPTQPLEGKHVIVVEDIVDTGRTLQAVLANLQAKNPSSLRVCTLLKKENPGAMEVALDYVGFIIPTKFVVGYGLDFAGRYRNMDSIAVLS